MPVNDRSELIPRLQQVQVEMGYVPKEAINEISKELHVSTNDIFGVLTFYTQFHLKPTGKHIVKVCNGAACWLKRAGETHQAFDNLVDADWHVEHTKLSNA